MSAKTKRTDPPTRRQQAILDFCRLSLVRRGFAPSIREIGEEVGLASSSTVHSHLRTLEAKGHISRNPSKPRAITLTDPPAAMLPPGVRKCLQGWLDGVGDADATRALLGQPCLCLEATNGRA
jgi:SOS-response transcriptional repressor LexA